VPQAAPPPGLPLSTTPLQSLSTPSQTSATAGRFSLHATAPFAHCVTPGPHGPGLPVLHATPPPGLFSSTAPLQSLSLPSHTSAPGARFSVQSTWPFAHGVVPAPQAPLMPVLHAKPPPGLFSSTTPLQLLSLPSQSSGWAATFSLQTS